jgi:hypothetical protein
MPVAFVQLGCYPLSFGSVIEPVGTFGALSSCKRCNAAMGGEIPSTNCARTMA